MRIRVYCIMYRHGKGVKGLKKERGGGVEREREKKRESSIGTGARDENKKTRMSNVNEKAINCVNTYRNLNSRLQLVALKYSGVKIESEKLKIRARKNASNVVQLRRCIQHTASHHLY